MCACARARIYMYMYLCKWRYPKVCTYYSIPRSRAVELCSQGLVCDLCMHSSSKACRLLSTSASRPRSVPLVSSPCARFVRRWTSEHQQWSLLVSVALLWQSKFKILRIKKREYRETRPRWGEAHNACVGTTEGF